MVKKQRNRRSLRKNKNKSKKNKVRFLGVNSAGISSKLHSFKNVVNALQPSVFFIQETKLKRQGKLKLDNFIIYELNRKKRNGGGLAIGVVEELKPVWISEGDDTTEVLVVEIDISGFKVRCVGGYGPQEKDAIEKKKLFWDKLSAEVYDAMENNAGFLLQMDGNLWVGPDVIKDDPNPCNTNGKLFKEFLLRFPHLKVVNSLQLCEGLITRKRTTSKRTEIAVLDFFVVCTLVLPFVEKMVVDEEKQYALSNYSNVKGKKHKIDSDHNTMFLDLSLDLPVLKADRKEIFNFKNQECQEVFLELTENSSSLRECFQTNGNVKSQSLKWLKNLNGVFHKSFRKVRVTNKQKETKLSILFKRRISLKDKLKYSCDNNEASIEELENVENEITSEISKENRDKVIESFKTLSETDGSININGMWSMKKKVFPKNTKPLPCAKKDVEGRLITSQNELKTLYLKTFVHRLRHRPIRDDLKHLEILKEELCNKRLEFCKLNKSRKWETEDFLKVLKALKNNKSRDPHGWINELFKPGVGGADLVQSILMMFNKIKEEITFPEFMEIVNIVCIYKGKGDKMDLNNDRGIFIVNVMKSIFMKMVWSEIYDTLDQNMSDSNVGGRRKKGIRNHLFIINGIINDVINGKKEPVDIEIIDYRQCFDSMWLAESINDLYESGIQDDNLALIHAANAKNQVAVKTPAGLTEREVVENIVMQGEVTGPSQCSNQVDTFGKECLEENKLLYQYREDVGVPPLGMVDDVIAVSRCGVESVAMNAFLNQKTSLKKLQFGPDKCHQLHVGRSNICCPELFIDEWALKKKDEVKAGIENLIDVHVDDHRIDHAIEEKYLGDIITVDGKNTKNIEARVGKAQGIIKQIKEMLEEMFFGGYMFEVAITLRNSLFINGILTNMEACYGLTEHEIDQLEKCDEQLLRTVLECPASTPKEMLYLELGVTPIRHIVMARRVMFYHYIINQDPKSLIYRFYQTQCKNPVKGDWCISVKENLETLKITSSEDTIRNLPEPSFRKIVNSAIKKQAFQYLVDLKNSHSKVLHIPYSNLELQDYLKPSRINPDLAKFTFLCRSRMLAVGANFKEGAKNPSCPLCDNSEYDSQNHLLFCDKINVNVVNKQTMFHYDDLFKPELDKKIIVARVLRENFQKRKRILEQRKEK